MIAWPDLLCDACLYLVETTNGEVLIADLCNRCRKKVANQLTEYEMQEKSQ